MKEKKLVTSDWHEMPDHLMVSERIEIAVTCYALECFDAPLVLLILLAVWTQRDTLLNLFCYNWIKLCLLLLLNL